MVCVGARRAVALGRNIDMPCDVVEEKTHVVLIHGPHRPQPQQRMSSTPKVGPFHCPRLNLQFESTVSMPIVLMPRDGAVHVIVTPHNTTSSSRRSTAICTKDADVYGTPCVFSGPPRRPQGGSVQGPQLFTVRIQRAREQLNNFIHEPVKLIRGANLGSEEAIGS